jgi:hypothetical protein
MSPVPGTVKLPEERWPHVTSPVALRVIERLYKAMPPGVHRGPAIDDPFNCAVEIHDYQQWLHEKLRRSGLAKALAGGPAFLADVSEHLDQPWRWIAGLLAPRKYEQLALKIRNNLEWYVDQSKPIRDPLKLASSVFWPSVALTLVLQLTLIIGREMLVFDWIAAFWKAILIFVVLFLTCLMFGKNTLKHHTNAAELYWYLLENYSEPEVETDADARAYAEITQCHRKLQSSRAAKRLQD